MATCTHCTRTLPDDAEVCSFCGKRISSAGAKKPKEDLLFQLRKYLKKEQIWWKRYGLILLVAGVLLLVWGGWSFLRGNLPALIVAACLLVLCVPALIVNLTQYGKVEEYIEGIYLDCSPALERAEDRKHALLSLFFNPMVFSVLIKNKAFIAAHQAALETLRKEQDQRYESTFRSDRLHNL